MPHNYYPREQQAQPAAANSSAPPLSPVVNQSSGTSALPNTVDQGIAENRARVATLAVGATNTHFQPALLKESERSMPNLHV